MPVNFAIALVIAAVAGCGPAPQGAARWTVNCTTDPVKAIDLCIAAGPTQFMGADGQPVSIDRPGTFWVAFEGNAGPFVAIIGHDFPGKAISIRFDDDSQPMTVTEGRANPAVVRRMLTADVARARYYRWPYATPIDVFVNLDGFPQVWAEFQAARAR